MPGIHRDDIPYEDAEKIVEALQKLHPGFKVQFVGDAPNSEKINERMSEFDEALHECWEQGLCFDCGKEIPCDWPLEEGQKYPDGWSRYNIIGQEGFYMLICPECEEETSDIGE